MMSPGRYLGRLLVCQLLLVDLKGKNLVNAETYLSTPLQKAKERAPHLGTISISTDTYTKLLAEFPEITVPNFSKTSTKHQVECYITTKVSPVHAHARRLPPDKLETAKAEFKQMEDMGIIQCSSSQWASSLLMVSKIIGGRRPYSDYYTGA